MLSVHALVDFDNAAGLASLGRSARLPDIDYALRSTVSSVVAFANTLTPRPSEVVLRLYGGWHDASRNTMTDLYLYAERSLREIPKRQRSFRLRPQLALSLLACPATPLLHTLRTRRYMPRVLFEEPSGCLDPANCTAHAALAWIKRGCTVPGCPVRGHEVFSIQEQKTIDTAIACDVVYLAGQASEDWILVVSDDDDLVPPLLAASSQSRRLALLRRRASAVYDELLSSCKVRVEAALFALAKEEVHVAAKRQH